ncbi:MAG: hypothetical protein ACOX4W_00985 [Bacilli bacterium]|mgnify:CR=1 FL=1|jgi:hypothetical protein
MIIASFLVQISIVLGLAMVFLISFLINKKIKVDGEKQNKCDGCTSHSCLFRRNSDVNEESEKNEKK